MHLSTKGLHGESHTDFLGAQFHPGYDGALQPLHTLLPHHCKRVKVFNHMQAYVFTWTFVIAP